jgi:hypothetical protein
MVPPGIKKQALISYRLSSLKILGTPTFGPNSPNETQTGLPNFGLTLILLRQIKGPSTSNVRQTPNLILRGHFMVFSSFRSPPEAFDMKVVCVF